MVTMLPFWTDLTYLAASVTVAFGSAGLFTGTGESFWWRSSRARKTWPTP